MGKLRSQRERLNLTVVDVKRALSIPSTVIIDLETDGRYRAHPAYEAYREMMLQHYDKIEHGHERIVGRLKTRSHLNDNNVVNSKTIKALLVIIEENRRILYEVNQITEYKTGYAKADKDRCASLSGAGISYTDKLLRGLCHD